MAAAAAENDDIDRELESLLTGAIQKLDNRRFTHEDAVDLMTAMWAACERSTGWTNTQMLHTEKYILDTALSTTKRVTAVFGEGTEVLDLHQVLLFVMCTLAAFPSTVQCDTDDRAAPSFQVSLQPLIIEEIRMVVYNFTWTTLFRVDMTQIYESVLKLLGKIGQKRQALECFMSDIFFSLFLNVNKIANLHQPNYKIRSENLPDWLLLSFGLHYVSSLMRMGFFESANIGFTALPSFSARHVHEEMKASYNFIHACLLLSSGQTQRALACLRYAQGQTTTKAMKDVVDDQIRRLTLEGNAVQQSQEYPDDDWLAGTNVAETERLAERQRNAQQKYQSKGKHKRPKRTDKSTMSSTKTSSSTLPSSLLAIPITSLFPSSSIPMSRVSCEKTSSKDGASSSSLSVPAPSEGSLPGDDDSDDDDEEDVTSGITESRFLPREEDESADNSEDLIEQVVTLLPDSTQEDWYTTSEKIPLLAQTNIYIAENQLHAYEKNKSKFYPELVTDQNEIEKMLKTEPNRYRHCQLVSIFPHEAEAKVIRGQTNPSQIFIHGRSRIGRTFLDEEVLVEVLAQPQGSDQNMPSSLDKMAHGQVVGSLRMVHYSDVSHPVFLCTLDEWDQNLMLPLCKTVPKLFILRKDSTLPENRARKSIDVYRITADGAIQYRDSFKLSQDRLDLYVFKVVYITWRHNRSVYPLGAVIAVHRTGKNYDTGLELLAMQQCLPTVYPAETIQHTKELVEAQGSMPSENMEDLRAKRVFTIDPPNSRDLDDALSIWKEGCHYIIGVHITDVASVVRPDLPVDVEARRRSFTFYPPNHKPHAMVPEPLSKRCSLLEGQDRLCMSVFFRVNNNGKVVDDPWVKKTVVKSCKQLTYAEVQAVLDGEDGDTDRELCEDIRLLFRLTNVLHEEREKTSRFCVPFKDPRVLGLEDPSVLGLEDPRVLEMVNMKDDSKARLLVGEWMIKANCYIAKRLREKFPNLMILRCQDAPSPKEMHEWLEKEGVVAHLPISLQDTKVTPNTTLSFSSTKLTSCFSQQSVILQSDVWRRLCRHLEDNEVSEARRLVFMDIVHPLQCLVVAHWWDLMFTAEYKCSYGLNGPEHRHFSLDVDFYTHFTSPLRRYPDLHVQRLLHADLDGTKPDCTPESVIQLCKHVNSVNKRLKCFSKSCTNLKLASRVQDQPLVFRAFLDTVETDHLKLCLPSLMHTSERNHEIPFSAMGVSRQPDINVNTMLNQATATVQWNKRIYDVKGQCPGSLRPVWGQLDRMKVAPNSADMQISRDHLSVLLKIKDWIKILKALVANDLCRINRTPHPVNHTRSEVEYMSSEKGNGKVCLRPVRYQTTFTTGQIIQLQMSAEPIRGMLEPCVDILHIARSDSICVKHTKNPVQTLTHSANRSTREQQFTSHEEYLKAWMPLVEMEAAAGAGYSDAAVTIHNVKVYMKTQNTGSFNLKSKFCTDRCISIGGKSPDSIPKETTRNQGEFPLDYVCLRYSTNCPERIRDSVKRADLTDMLDTHVTWLAHGGVMSVRKKGMKDGEGGYLNVNFHLSHISTPPPSSLMDKEGANVTLELLPKSEVDRRAQDLLLQLEDKGCELARALAYGDTLPSLGKRRRELGEDARYHDVEMPADGMSFIPMNNTRQLTAVRMALTNTLTLIQGPPGTGKTYTGIKLIYQFTRINRKLAKKGREPMAVLFCGPTNKAVDLVANLMREKLGSDCVKMVRVYGSAMEMKDYPVPRGDLRSRRTTQDLHCDQKLNDVALHHLIREDGRMNAKEICEMERHFARLSQTAEDSGAVSSQQLKRYRQLVFDACVEELRHYEVIFTTCAVAGSQRLIEGMRGRVFQVIIDECAMCPEPLSMVPIVGAQAKQLVLIGDHKQLRPILECSTAADLGLDQSLFERLFCQFPQQKVRLNRQYRMHPQLCQFPSEQFYEGDLHTALSISWTKDPLPFWPDNTYFSQEKRWVWQDEANQKVPHVFIDVRGQEKALTVSGEEGSEYSRSNSLEAEKVMEIVGFLKEQYLIHLSNVMILTFYKAQKHDLQVRLQAACEDRNQEVFQRYDKQHLNISTVVSSQGGEWDYVVLSTVRSLPSYQVEKRCTRGWRRQSLGFLTNDNQVNVALTRPRLGLFIVGNQELLRCDPNWNALLEKYEEQGCIFTADQFPPPAPPGARPNVRRY